MLNNFSRIIYEEMHSLSEIRNTLKSLPFYSEEIKSLKKNNKKFSNIKPLSELPFFPKKTRKLNNYQLSKVLPFFPKRSKKLTKHQIIKIPYHCTTQ